MCTSTYILEHWAPKWLNLLLSFTDQINKLLRYSVGTLSETPLWPACCYLTQSILHMFDCKSIVLFTFPFHFQLNTKSQNTGFHFKLLTDFIFDLVMSPQNDLKLITDCFTLHYESTFIFHVFHISTLRCPDLARWLKSGLWCSAAAQGYLPVGRPGAPRQPMWWNPSQARSSAHRVV